MFTITLTPAQTAAIASLHAATPQAKTDRDVTPILTAIHVTVTGDTLTATATDRYMVVESAFPIGDGAATIGEERSFMLNSKDWQSIAKLKTPVTLTIDDDSTVTVAHASGTLNLLQVQGNFPRVQRIFSDGQGDLAQGTGLDLAKLARLAKIVPASPYLKDEASVWEFSQPGENKPVTLTRPRLPEGESMRALIQPNLRIRR